MTLALLFAQSSSGSFTAAIAETAATHDAISISMAASHIAETAATSDAVTVSMASTASVAETSKTGDAPATQFQIMINLVGPSTSPGAPEITPAEINAQVNAALAAVVAQSTLLARSQAAITPYLSDVGTTTRTPAARFGDMTSPFDFGAIGDGASHPASSVFPSLAACQAVYPFATDLSQEMDWLAWQAALYAGGRVYSRPITYKMCNSNPASMTPLIVLAGTVYVTGNGAVMDWTDIRTQPNTTHYITNYDFSDGGTGWVSDTIDFPVSAPVFEGGTAYCADPPSFCRFGQRVTLQPGRYVVKWTYTATLGGSYPANPSPPFGEINFWSDAPGGGGQFPWPLPAAMSFPNLTSVITAGDEGVTVSGLSNLFIAEEYTGYLCFTGGGYANWRVSLLDIIPFQPNCGIWVTKDNSPGGYYCIDRAICGLEMIGSQAGAADINGSTAPTCILIESFVNNDGNLADFQDCSIHGWGQGIWPRDGAYLLEFRNCLLYGNDVALYFNGAQNSGENIRFYGGSIFNNLFGVINPHPFGEFTFYGTALDYNYRSIAWNAGKLEYHGVHIENNLKDAPIFHCMGGAIMLYGGTILGVAPLIDPSLVVPPIQLDDSNSLMTCFGTQIYNLTSANGQSTAGPGTLRLYGWINTGNPNIDQPATATISLDALGGIGSLEPLAETPFIEPDPTGIYLEGGVYTTEADPVVTNRWTLDHLALSITTDQHHTGTRCIQVVKTAPPGDDYQILFLIPVRQGQDAQLTFWWYSPTSYQAPTALASITWESVVGVGTATATTEAPHGYTIGDKAFLYIQGADQAPYNGIVYCTFTTTTEFTYQANSNTALPPATGAITWCPCVSIYSRTFWAKQISVDAYGRPVLSPANTFKGENDIAIPLCGYPDWVEHGGSTFYGPSTTDATLGDSPGAPVWATHMAIVLDTESLPEMTLFLDDFAAFIA